MISRRTLLARSAGIAAGLVVAPRVDAAPVLTDDGLYSEPWFLGEASRFSPRTLRARPRAASVSR